MFRIPSIDNSISGSLTAKWLAKTFCTRSLNLLQLERCSSSMLLVGIILIPANFKFCTTLYKVTTKINLRLQPVTEIIVRRERGAFVKIRCTFDNVALTKDLMNYYWCMNVVSSFIQIK